MLRQVYVLGVFLSFCSGGFLSVVFRVLRDDLLAFMCLLGSPGGSPRRHFWKKFENFPILGVALKAWQALCFSDISELRGTPEDEKR